MPHTAHAAMRTISVAALGLMLAGLSSTVADAAVQQVLRASVRASEATTQDSFNRDVRVHNQTGWTMTYVYAASTGSETWGGDLLRSRSLAPGDSLVMTINDGSGACRYDLRAGFDNGEALRRNDIDVCRIADYYFTR